MTLDHVAWKFFPLTSICGQIFHLLGRITAPIMCYLLVEGYHHTKNINKYTLRMGSFALISAAAYNFYSSTTGIQYHSLGMIYTLFLALISLRIFDSAKLKLWQKGVLILGLLMLSMEGDWEGIGIIWPLIFHIFRENEEYKFRLFYQLTVFEAALLSMIYAFNHPALPYGQMFQFGMLLSLPLLRKYNGKLGGTKRFKWLFYIYYPLHLCIIRIICIFIQ